MVLVALQLKKALELLAGDDLITRQPGRGSFVKRASGFNHKLKVNNQKGEQTALLFGLVITDFDDSYGTELISSLEKCSTKHSSFFNP